MTMIIDHLGTFNERKTSCHSGSEINWTLTLSVYIGRHRNIHTNGKKSEKRTSDELTALSMSDKNEIGDTLPAHLHHKQKESKFQIGGSIALTRPPKAVASQTATQLESATSRNQGPTRYSLTTVLRRQLLKKLTRVEVGIQELLPPLSAVSNHSSLIFQNLL